MTSLLLFLLVGFLIVFILASAGASAAILALWFGAPTWLGYAIGFTVIAAIIIVHKCVRAAHPPRDYQTG